VPAPQRFNLFAIPSFSFKSTAFPLTLSSRQQVCLLLLLLLFLITRNFVHSFYQKLLLTSPAPSPTTPFAFPCLLEDTWVASCRTYNRSTVIIINNPNTTIMKTFAIAAVLAATAIATPSATEKRSKITPVTVKGNGMVSAIVESIQQY